MEGDLDYDREIQSKDSFQFERQRVEPIYESFICPLTKEVMRDPVTIANGQTFERRAVENWFKECRDQGRKLICPLTLQELKSAEVNPCIALRITIEEWRARNDSFLLGMARTSINTDTAENEVLQALNFVQHLCKTSHSNEDTTRNAELIPLIVDVLKSSSSRVRCKALETLRIVVEVDTDSKAILSEGDTVRTILKFLSYERTKDREEAISLLYELSKSEALCEKIGSVNGAILILVLMSSSNTENKTTVDMAENTLQNLEICEKNVKQMAENHRIQPLLNQILEKGSQERKLSMISYLGGLALNNESKVLVARTVGYSLIEIMRHGNLESREASLRALNQVSSYEPSAKMLVEAGILSPLVMDLLTAGASQLPLRLKEVAATILANIIIPECDFYSIPVGPDHQTLVSEEIVHNLLRLISNTGPNIECKLLQVLVGLTSSQTTVVSVAAAIKSSGALTSLVQFIDVPQKDLRVACIKLLQNLAPHMDQELANALRGAIGQLGNLVTIISENTGITEEQAAAAGLLAELPKRDLGLTRQLLDCGAFSQIYNRIMTITQRETRRIRFRTPFLEGLVMVLARLTFALAAELDAIEFCRDYEVASLFINLLQHHDLDKVQMISAMALENLSQETKNLTRLPELAQPSFCVSIFPCFSKEPMITGLCQVHRGRCSLKDTFCLLEGKAVEKIVALLDHTNEKVVEVTLAAISTLLEDGVNIEHGVKVLMEAEAIGPIFDVLLESRTDPLRRRSVWAVERLLRSDEIASNYCQNQQLGTALVDAFQNADSTTTQIAERALKHIDRIPNFSCIYPPSQVQV